MTTINQDQNARRPAKYTAEALYNLLPSVYRQRDEELRPAGPLKAILRVIAEQIGILENDIQRLYENWFIETCDPWVVPYIGDLIGATFPRSSVEGKTINRRSFVANTIFYRQRKGTIFVVGRLAKDLTGWGSKAVEFFLLLSTTQFLNHLRLSNLGTLDLRNVEQLQLLDTAFDTAAHTVEVRSIADGTGRYNVQNIGIYVWRIEAYPAFNAPAFKVNDRNFTFNVLGQDTQLFNHPVTESMEQQAVRRTDLPTPISRLDLYFHLTDYYATTGLDKSIKIRVNGMIRPIDDIVACDLTEWTRSPPDGKIAIDPVLGRISFSSVENPQDVHVSYYYGFSSEVGGGLYARPGPDVIPAKVYRISKAGGGGVGGEYPSIQGATAQWIIDLLSDSRNRDAIFSIVDSEVYSQGQAIDLTLPSGSNLEIRSEEGTRPTISNCNVNITGEAPSAGLPRANLTINGLLFDNCQVNIMQGDLGGMTFRHCTLVPRSTRIIANSGNDNLTITVDHTIAGPMDSSQCEGSIQINDSIIDGGGQGQDNMALNCYEARVQNSTLFGEVTVIVIDSISNSIFTDKVVARRRQTGCVRFSLIPNGSRVPRSYHCQPSYPEGATDAEKQAIWLNVKPRFTSKKYGMPGYAQLHKSTSIKIFEGADNGNEMGVFNHLQQADRLANLKSAVDEYTRFGLETGVICVT